MSRNPRVTATESPITIDPREAQIIGLVRQGRGVTDIVEQVWGVRGGGKFAERSAEVMRVIAANLREG